MSSVYIAYIYLCCTCLPIGSSVCLYVCVLLSVIVVVVAAAAAAAVVVLLRRQAVKDNKLCNT